MHVETLDTLLHGELNHLIGRVAMVKIDVEGHEDAVSSAHSARALLYFIAFY